MKTNDKWEGPFYELHTETGYAAYIQPEATDGNKVTGWVWAVRSTVGSTFGNVKCQGKGKSLQHAMMLAEQALVGLK